MPRPADLQTRAMSLAKIERGLAAERPFARQNDTKRWAYHDIAVREMLLLAVKDVYEACWEEHYDPLPGQDNTEARQAPGQMRLQYAAKWTRTLATTYKDEPERVFYYKGERLDEDDPRVEALQKAYRDAMVNERLEVTDYDLRQFGNETWAIYYDEDFGKWSIHRYPSYAVRVVENELTPRCPWATVLVGEQHHRDDSGRASKTKKAQIWVPPTRNEAGQFINLVDNNITDAGPLVTQRPPLIHFADCPQDNMTRFYVNALGLQLARLNVAVNEDYLNPLGYTTLMQGFAQMVLTGAGKDAKIEIGPGRAIKLNPTGDADWQGGVEFAQPNAPLTEIVDVMQSVIAEIRQVHDIPAEELDVQTDSSGAAIVQAKAPLAERRKARFKIFREPENEIMRTFIDVGRSYGVTGFEGFGSHDLEDYEVSVGFGPPEISQNTQDRIAQEKHDLSLGIITEGDILMRRYPDRFDSAEEAQEFIDANKKKRAVEQAAQMKAAGFEPGQPGDKDDVTPGSQKEPDEDRGEEK